MWNGVGRTSPFSKASITVQSDETKSFRIKNAKKAKVTKKKLNYNSREISAQIARARKSKGAADALTRAKGKVSMLKRCLGSGQYDIDEVRIAIAHASKMVGCAGKKLRNLREEERESSQSERVFQAEASRLKAAAKQKLAAKEQEQRRQIAQQEMLLERKMKEQQLQLARKKQQHRSEEYGELNEADMTYLKQKLKGMEGTEQRSCEGAMMEISFSAMQMSELAQQEQMLKQMELQAAQELAQIEAGAAMLQGGSPEAVATTATTATAAAPVSTGGSVPAVNVSV